MINSSLMEPSAWHVLRQLWRKISEQRRKGFVQLVVLTFIGAFAEILSLGAVVPFIGVITQPELVLESNVLRNIFSLFDVTSESDVVIAVTILFGVAAASSGFMRLLVLKSGIRLGNLTGADLGIGVYRRTLYQPYDVHVSRNTSTIISGITQKIDASTTALISTVNVITAFMLFIAIMTTLLVVDTTVAMLAVVSFGVGYGTVAWNTRKKLLSNSKDIATQQTTVVKALQEGLGAIRDILLDGTQEVFSKSYSTSVIKLRAKTAENSYISQAPRYIMEALGMALISIFVLVLSFQPGGVVDALPILAVFALGAQRLLPLMQQMYGNWSVVMGSKAALLEVIELLDQELPELAGELSRNRLKISSSIALNNVLFQYSEESPWVLKGVSLQVKKGDRIGIVGKTGGGKSTLVDILMGLLHPSQGNLLVDDVVIGPENVQSWQQNIAHVPQSIFLTDGTILENIAFGVPIQSIDHERVEEAARQAQLLDFISSHREGLNALIGERGVRLSGGQRQRIGIARALYKRAEIIVFDEATNALDGDTELSVMEAIDSLQSNLTLFIIAHRISTLKNCTSIVRLENGTIGRYETYSESIQ